jgi:NADPH:quinone reductase-like Zn-dependent oxidoreductase
MERAERMLDRQTAVVFAVPGDGRTSEPGRILLGFLSLRDILDRRLLDLLRLFHKSFDVSRHAGGQRRQVVAVLQVASAAELFEVVVGGAVKIEVRQTYPLAETARAHRDLAARQTTGSTVLLP